LARNIYRVVPDSTLWAVQIGRRVLGRWRSRDNAIRRAAAMAEGDQPSLVIVHRRDGSIEYERPHGHDPHPAVG